MRVAALAIAACATTPPPPTPPLANTRGWSLAPADLVAVQRVDLERGASATRFEYLRELAPGFCTLMIDGAVVETNTFAGKHVATSTREHSTTRFRYRGERLVEVATDGRPPVELDYDAAGRLVRDSERPTTYQYDRGRVAIEHEPRAERRIAYDDAGNVREVVAVGPAWGKWEIETTPNDDGSSSRVVIPPDLLDEVRFDVDRAGRITSIAHYGNYHFDVHYDDATAKVWFTSDKDKHSYVYDYACRLTPK